MSEQLIAARSVCIKLGCLFVVYYSYIWHRKALNHACYQHTTPTFVRTLGGYEIYHCELELDGQALMDNAGCFWEVRAKRVPSTTQRPRGSSGMQSCLPGMAWTQSTYALTFISSCWNFMSGSLMTLWELPHAPFCLQNCLFWGPLNHIFLILRISKQYS